MSRALSANVIDEGRRRFACGAADGLSAEQYLQFVGRARGLGKQVRQVAVDTLLQVVGLEERRWRDVDALSPGERRRLALASALVHEPDVLLLDDPLRGLDGFARLERVGARLPASMIRHDMAAGITGHKIGKER